MILETKQVLFRAHVHSLDRRSTNAYDHLEQTLLTILLRSIKNITNLSKLIQNLITIFIKSGGTVRDG